ncbi:2OG-Fe(II) oxygenase [Cyclobacterium jeungdonense]|uniref:2OG-Fe(II) oxygenase n=1 Tax=Cyclobacterium jeungdonense TaxID=708087 RepID=A0ABT8C3I8_9BACT|nr:2OG-Fe(II) oxygenase [Cyclobacterium jeungdonense]MDN3687340.1 2OG-Fe(II) oxygenase [Cyclobacterium jeungdonense]
MTQYTPLSSTSTNEQIAQELYQNGWSITDQYISESFRKELLEEQQDLVYHGQFRHAGVGKGESFAIQPEIRSDKVLWMDEMQLTPLQQTYWDMLENLRLAINQRCYLGLRSYEAHFAMYPPGSFYLRHLDQFQSVSYRKVTVILYLNEHWETSDGGALRMYFTAENGVEEYRDVLPVGGRLVTFLSGEIPHEVLPTKKARISITGWFKDS